MSAHRTVGKRLARLDGVGKVTGAARYGVDQAMAGAWLRSRASGLGISMVPPWIGRVATSAHVRMIGSGSDSKPAKRGSPRESAI